MADVGVNVSSQLASLMSTIVRSLVLLPDDVRIEIQERDNTILFFLSVDPSDRGRIIGNKGKIVHSIRLLFQSICTIHGRNAVIEIREFPSTNSI